MTATPCQQTIKYLLCFFSLLNDGVIGNLVAAVQLAKQIAVMGPNSTIVCFLENELNCHDQ